MLPSGRLRNIGDYLRARGRRFQLGAPAGQGTRYVRAASVYADIDYMCEHSSVSLPVNLENLLLLARVQPAYRAVCWYRICGLRRKFKPVESRARVKELVEELPAVRHRRGVGVGSSLGPFLSCDTDRWFTGVHWSGLARFVLGRIGLDPYSEAAANVYVRAEHFFTIDDDGNAPDWFSTVFTNPPGGASLDRTCQRQRPRARKGYR